MRNEANYKLYEKLFWGFESFERHISEKNVLSRSAVSGDLGAIDSNRSNRSTRGLYPLSQWFPRLYVGITARIRGTGKLSTV